MIKSPTNAAAVCKETNPAILSVTLRLADKWLKKEKKIRPYFSLHIELRALHKDDNQKDQRA